MAWHAPNELTCSPCPSKRGSSRCRSAGRSPSRPISAMSSSSDASTFGWRFGSANACEEIFKFCWKVLGIVSPRSILQRHLLLLLAERLPPHHLTSLLLRFTRAHVAAHPPVQKSVTETENSIYLYRLPCLQSKTSLTLPRVFVSRTVWFNVIRKELFLLRMWDGTWLQFRLPIWYAQWNFIMKMRCDLNSKKVLLAQFA